MQRTARSDSADPGRSPAFPRVIPIFRAPTPGFKQAAYGSPLLCSLPLPLDGKASRPFCPIASLRFRISPRAVHGKFPRRFAAAEHFLLHRFCHRLLKFRCVSFVWPSLRHTIAPVGSQRILLFNQWGRSPSNSQNRGRFIGESPPVLGIFCIPENYRRPNRLSPLARYMVSSA